HRARLLEQAHRPRAPHRGENGEDARRQPARQARRRRPYAGSAVRDAPQVLGPIPDSAWVQTARTVEPCPQEFSPEPHSGSASTTPPPPSNAAGPSSSTRAAASTSSVTVPATPRSSRARALARTR